jgi:endogenous inhibitor of DNA gyrase (YacG/DUF329 family)|nr:DNA gyrase inhibitor YacG [Candidatus Nucleicultrix amoebiphila]
MKNVKCPICKKPSVEKYRPFCSERCKMIDLGKWLGEAYSIPIASEDTKKEPQKLEDEND